MRVSARVVCTHAFAALGIFVLLAPLTLADSPDTAGRNDSGGGEWVLPSDRITPEQRRAIWIKLEQNRARLIAEGKLTAAPRAAPPLLDFPLQTANGLDVNGFYGISGYVDQNPNFPGFLLDYNCGTRTYDTTSGYNHQGIDYFTWPFQHIWVQNNQVVIVSAAPGMILGKDDGNFDANCAFNNNNWNAVYIQHADGSIIWYGHMKNGSTTPKAVGQSVAAGEYLGVVASSGNSTGPHLHLELYDTNIFLQEPHYLPGQCNSMNNFSWWTDQESYRVSKINLLTTGFAAPVVNTCPNLESPNLEVNFFDGQTFYLTGYFRDQLPSQTTQFTIYAPDDSVWDSWSQSGVGPFSASWWWWSRAFTPGDAYGDYRWEVVYEGQTHEAVIRLNRISQITGGVELIADKSGSNVELHWTVDCLGNATDYAVYEGQIGNWTSHLPVPGCTTGGVTNATVTPTQTNSYFLVVPNGPTYEGSYGLDSEGDERATSASSCRGLQSAGLCPQ